jgi:cell division protein FtsZ
MQAGEHTDVIVGTGYDNALGAKIGITLIATGFDAKDPFAKPAIEKKPEPKPEKIVMILDVAGEEKKVEEKPVFVQQEIPVVAQDPFAPTMVETVTETIQPNSHSTFTTDYFSTTTPHNVEIRGEEEKESAILHFELSTEISTDVVTPQLPLTEPTVTMENELNNPSSLNDNTTESVVNNSFLTRPSNIYAEPDYEKPSSMSGHLMQTPPATQPVEEHPELEMKLVVRDETPDTADVAPVKAQKQDLPSNLSAEEPALLDDVEEQKRRAAERIQKLRNLSFNVNNASDSNHEFDAVPAYIRRNMELFGNTLTSVENFYSKYTVNKDENDNSHISTINTFLDGKKPD